MRIAAGTRVLGSVLVAGPVVALVVALAGPAGASDSPKDQPKYQIMRADNERVWRLNTETGEIVVCQMENARMVCASSGETVDKSRATADDLEQARERERTAAREDKFATMDRLMVFFERFMKMISELKPGGGETVR